MTDKKARKANKQYRLFTHDKDSVQELKDKNRRLANQVKHLKQLNNRLVSENKTLMESWSVTKDFLISYTKNQNVENLIEISQLGHENITNDETECEKCHTTDTLLFDLADGSRLIICKNCNNRQKLVQNV